MGVLSFKHLLLNGEEEEKSLADNEMTMNG